MTEPIVSRKTYVLTYLALLLLTGITVVVAYINLGPLSTVVAIGIAALKATVIAMVFMHVVYETKLIKLVVGAAILWFVILVFLTLTDYLTRGWLIGV